MAKLCPCGTGKAYTDCCGLYLGAGQYAPTPEALMRSRYTAYKKDNLAYIAKTQKAALESRSGAKIHWLKLEIVCTSLSADGQRGEVEFKAYYQHRGTKHVLHEVSQFSLENNQWLYVEGEILQKCCSGH